MLNAAGTTTTAATLGARADAALAPEGARSRGVQATIETPTSTAAVAKRALVCAAEELPKCLNRIINGFRARSPQRVSG